MLLCFVRNKKNHPKKTADDTLSWCHPPLLSDFISNDPSNRYWDGRPAGKQATLEERVTRLMIQISATDDVPRRWRRLWYWGNIAFCSAVYSTTCMSSATFMLPVCAHIHSAQYIISCRRKKKEKRKRELSQLWKKKNIIDHILLTVDCSETNYFNIEEG